MGTQGIPSGELPKTPGVRGGPAAKPPPPLWKKAIGIVTFLLVIWAAYAILQGLIHQQVIDNVNQLHKP